MKQHLKKIKANLSVIFMKEADVFICYCPALEQTSHGESFGDAYDSFKTTLSMFVEEVIKMGTLEKVLFDCGWEKIGDSFSPPEIIGQKIEPFEIAVPA